MSKKSDFCLLISLEDVPKVGLREARVRFPFKGMDGRSLEKALASVLQPKAFKLLMKDIEDIAKGGA